MALSDTIAEVAAAPKSTTVDGQTTVEHSIKDLVDAEQQEAENAAKNKSKLSMRVGKFTPGGTV